MTDDDRLAYLIDLIRHRVPEATEADIARLLVESDEEMIPGRIVMQVIEVIDRMSDRMEGFERQFAASEPVPARLH
jgi:hypothetical protein